MRTTENIRAEQLAARWRERQLLTAGFDEPLARRLAHDDRWDVHALIKLVELGCRPALAARIMAPLDAPHEA